MSKLKSLAAAAFALAAVVYVAAPTAARAQGPHYLEALSDLRTARDYIQSDHRHDFEHERHHAVDEINKAIDEIKHAAWDDGKQTKYAPPPHPDTDPWNPMREGIRWIDGASDKIRIGVDRPENEGLRDRAMMHIREARGTLATLIQQGGQR